MSIKYRSITDSILHFYMQPPNPNADASILQQKGGILFFEDTLALKYLLQNNS